MNSPRSRNWDREYTTVGQKKNCENFFYLLCDTWDPSRETPVDTNHKLIEEMTNQ